MELCEGRGFAQSCRKWMKLDAEVPLLSSLMHSAAEHAVPEDIFYHAVLQRAASDTCSSIHSQYSCLLVNLLKCIFLNLLQRTKLHSVLLILVCMYFFSPQVLCFLQCVHDLPMKALAQERADQGRNLQMLLFTSKCQ